MRVAGGGQVSGGGWAPRLFSSLRCGGSRARGRWWWAAAAAAVQVGGVVVSISSPLAGCCCCWRLVFGAGSSNSFLPFFSPLLVPRFPFPASHNLCCAAHCGGERDTQARRGEARGRQRPQPAISAGGSLIPFVVQAATEGGTAPTASRDGTLISQLMMFERFVQHVVAFVTAEFAY